MRRLPLIATLAACALASPAQAATVHIDEVTFDENPRFEWYSLTYAGAPGEHNRVTVRFDRTTGQPGVVTITDPGASGMTAGTPDAASACVFEAHRAVCRQRADHDSTGSMFHLEGGDGDDTVAMRVDGNDGVWYDGGPGDDAITHSGTESGYLEGGPGDDVLLGGDGGDDLYGGPGADRVDGRGGTGDSVYYERYPWDDWPGEIASTGVSVSADGVANDGAPGEGDDVSANNEWIHGTGHADVLTGGGLHHTLFGYAGDDRFRGGPGVDRFDCGAGQDVVVGDLLDLPIHRVNDDGSCESASFAP